jgi:hypothetical protein
MIIALLLDPGSQARTILHHLLERADIAGSGAAGPTVITFAVDDRLLEQLLTFDAGSEDLEDDGDAEPDDDAEQDGRVFLMRLGAPITQRPTK